MNPLKTIVFAALIAAGVAVPVLLHRNSDNQLRGKLDLLEQQKDRLALLEAENAHLAKRPVQSNSAPELSPEKLAELLKLRSDVGAMRSQTNAIPQLQAENRQLRSAGANSPRTSTPADSAPGAFVPRESWTFAGYATPEATLQSVAWAISKGDKKTLLQSIDADSAELFAKDIGAKSDEEFAAAMAQVAESLSSYRILKQEYISNDEALLQVALGGDTNKTDIMKMKRVGAEWKLSKPFH